MFHYRPIEENGANRRGLAITALHHPSQPHRFITLLYLFSVQVALFPACSCCDVLQPYSFLRSTTRRWGDESSSVRDSQGSPSVYPLPSTVGIDPTNSGRLDASMLAQRAIPSKFRVLSTEDADRTSYYPPASVLIVAWVLLIALNIVGIYFIFLWNRFAEQHCRKHYEFNVHNPYKTRKKRRGGSDSSSAGSGGSAGVRRYQDWMHRSRSSMGADSSLAPMRSFTARSGFASGAPAAASHEQPVVAAAVAAALPHRRTTLDDKEVPLLQSESSNLTVSRNPASTRVLSPPDGGNLPKGGGATTAHATKPPAPDGVNRKGAIGGTVGDSFTEDTSTIDVDF